MALDRIDATPISYVRGSSEIIEPSKDSTTSTATQVDSGSLSSPTADSSSEGTFKPLKDNLYLSDELDSIQSSIGSLARFVPQVAIVEPSELYRGLIRYCKDPWDPIGDGYEGLVYYDGSSWLRLDFTTDISDLQSQITANDGDITALQSGKADASHTHPPSEIQGAQGLVGRTSSGSGNNETITLGKNLTFNGTALDAGGGSKVIRNWLPTDASFPSSGYATLDTRNTHPVLDFSDSAYENVFFHGIMPDNYETDASIDVSIWYSMTSASSGNVVWLARIENMNGLNISTDSFTANWGSIIDSVPASAGVAKRANFSLTLAASLLDGITAGDLFRLQVLRSGPDGNDTAPGDAELLMVEMRIQ